MWRLGLLRRFATVIDRADGPVGNQGWSCGAVTRRRRWMFGSVMDRWHAGHVNVVMAGSRSIVVRVPHQQSMGTVVGIFIGSSLMGLGPGRYSSTEADRWAVMSVDDASPWP